MFNKLKTLLDRLATDLLLQQVAYRYLFWFNVVVANFLAYFDNKSTALLFFIIALLCCVISNQKYIMNSMKGE